MKYENFTLDIKLQHKITTTNKISDILVFFSIILSISNIYEYLLEFLCKKIFYKPLYIYIHSFYVNNKKKSRNLESFQILSTRSKSEQNISKKKARSF